MDPEYPRAHLWIRDIQENNAVAGSYLVREKRLLKTKSNKPFLSLTLSDKTGDMEGRLWDGAEEHAARFQEGEVIQVEGRAVSYRDQIQMTLSSLEPIKGTIDPSLFLESAPEPAHKMLHDLRVALRQVENRHLRKLIDLFSSDARFMARFQEVPAAKNFHHGYVGGLLEHTLSVCRMALLVSGHYPELDRDLLLTGAFLHDIGKTKELSYPFRIDYTDEGRLVGHVVIGAILLEEKMGKIREFPEELSLKLRHMILSHHGQYDFGSPKQPKFLEAFALHLIDDLDAKINGIQRLISRDKNPGSWTDYSHMFGRYFLKGPLSVQGDLPEYEEEEGASGLQGTLFS